jgi:hypothetical protein
MRKYARTLKGVAFDVKDGQLPGGACINCVKCSNRDSEFFGKTAEMCYDLDCFQIKLNAVWQREKQAAVQAGLKVLPEKEAAKIVDERGGIEYNFQEKYLNLDDKPSDCEMTGKNKPAKYEKLLAGLDLPVILARDAGGVPRRLVDKAAALAGLTKAGRIIFEKQRGGRSVAGRSASEKAQLQKEKDEQQLKARSSQLALTCLYGKMVDADGKFKALAGLWRRVYDYTLASYAAMDGCSLLGQTFGLQRKKKSPGAWQEALEADAKGRSDGELQALTLMARWVKYNGVQQDLLKDLAELYQVPLASLLKQAKEDLKKGKQPAEPLPKRVTPKILKA